MKHHDAKTVLFSSTALILLLGLVSMTSCAPTTTAKKNDRVNPIANAKNIGKVLGCMFGGCKPKADQDQTQPASK